MLTLHTNLGDIELTLYADKSPKTVENFLRYAKSGFYAGTIFHRVIDHFMIQGGGFKSNLLRAKPTRATIKNEASNGLKNLAYTIAMARTMAPHSASSQFFINVADNDFLDYTAPIENGWGYCVFGQVTAGREVVDRIKTVATTTRNGHKDVPKQEVFIERVSILYQPSQ